ncbi:MAG TPA: hypothetical protein ENK91_13270 [Bacteroidetes bacterium]|nr:hypothetical protein [Bacteroidota bacterium]
MKHYINIITFFIFSASIFAQEFNSINDSSSDFSFSEIQQKKDIKTPVKYSGVLFGLNVGLNVNTGFYDYKTGPNPPSGSFMLAPSGGMLLGFQFSKLFSIQSFLKYQIKGDRIDVAKWLNKYEAPPTVNAVWEIEPSGIITTSLHYIEASLIPVFGIGDFRDGMQIQFGAGGFAAYGLKGTEKNDYSFKYYLDSEFDSEDIVEETKQVEFVKWIPTTNADNIKYFNGFDYGLLFYGGLRYNKINVGINFSWGMKQLEYGNLDFGYWTKAADISKTATATFSLTYIF